MSSVNLWLQGLACAADAGGELLQPGHLVSELVSLCSQFDKRFCAFSEKLSGGGGFASAGGKAGISCWVGIGAGFEAGKLCAQAAQNSGSRSSSSLAGRLTLGLFMGDFVGVTLAQDVACGRDLVAQALLVGARRLDVAENTRFADAPDPRDARLVMPHSPY